jgi:hypothetical protein
MIAFIAVQATPRLEAALAASPAFLIGEQAEQEYR